MQNENVDFSEIDLDNFLIGEFSKMERLDSVVVKDSRGIRKEPKTSFQAFILRDKNLHIFHKSYGLHARTILRKRPKVIRIFNAQLHQYIENQSQANPNNP
jgi:hypothetical protein